MTKTDDAVVKSDTNRDVTKWDVVTEEKLDKNMPSAVNDNSEHGAVTQPDGVTKYRTETKSHSTGSLIAKVTTVMYVIFHSGQREGCDSTVLHTTKHHYLIRTDIKKNWMQNAKQLNPNTRNQRKK